MTDAHETVDRRLAEANLGTERYIEVIDGEKYTHEHDVRYPSPGAAPGQNYGVYADDDPLVVLDIDDHDGGDDDVSAVAVAALGALPPTLETASPHGGTHRFYKISDTEDVGETLSDRLGVKNPVPTWGEVQASNKYVVGAGSQLDGCGKDWHDGCAEPDGGRYTVQADRPVAEIGTDDLVDALAADPELSDNEAQQSLGGASDGSGGDTGDDETFDGEGYDGDRETVADALACVSPDLDYNEWRNIGWAICDALDGDREAAKEVYLEYSKGEYHPDLSESGTASKWDGDARKRAKRVIDDWEPPSDGDVTAGTLWNEALDDETGPAAWDPPSDWGRADPRKEKIAEHSEKYDSAADVPDAAVSRGGTIDENAPVGPENPAGELAFAGDIDDDSYPSATISGAYGYLSRNQTREGEVYYEWEEATNFTLETLAIVEIDDEQQFRIRVVPETDESPYEVEVHPTVFNETRAFKEEVVRGMTTTFENAFGDALDDLRLTVGQQDCPRHTGVAHVGAARPAHDDDDLPADAWSEWVTPDGVLTADGWLDVDEGEHTYIARSQSQTSNESIVGERWELTPDHDSIDAEEVRETLRRLPKARLPAQALSTLSWFYCAPLRPLLYHAEEQFPHLSVRGKTASGKTAWLSQLTEALGMGGTPFAADATGFSLEMMHVGSRGAPVWIDEYKPSQMSERTRDKLHTCLRESTRETTHTKGRPDQSFVSYRMKSPICLSGEQTVKEPAVARRSMQVQLSSQATDMAGTARAYAELAGEAYEAADGSTVIPEGYDLTNHALAYHRWLLSHDAQDLLDAWADCTDKTEQLIDATGADVSDTERQAVQTIVFGTRLFRRFARAYDVPDADLPSDETLESAVAHVTGNVGKNGQRREHGDDLLELMSMAAAADYLEPDDLEHGDTPYRVYEPQAAAGDAIAVHLPSVYPEVQKFVRDYNLESEYNLLSKPDYTDEFSDIAGDDSHILATSKKVRNVVGNTRKRCLEIDATRARDRLGEDFIASAFGASVETETLSDSDDSGGDDDNQDSDRAEKPLAPSEVTVEAANARGRLPAIEATVSALYQDRYNNATVALSGDDGVLDATVLGDATHADLVEGERVRVVGAKVTTDENGVVEAEIRPDAEVVPLTSFPSATDDDGGGEPAAADGGAAATTAATPDAPQTDSDDETAADDGESEASDESDAHGAETVDTTVVVPTESLGTIMGVDGVDYKIEVDEPVELPARNAEPLIAQGAAEEIENANTVGSVRGRVTEWIRTHEPQSVTAPTLAGKDEIDAPPDVVASALARIASTTRLLEENPEVGSGSTTGYVVLE